jgi:dCTP deaminase
VSGGDQASGAADSRGAADGPDPAVTPAPSVSGTAPSPDVAPSGGDLEARPPVEEAPVAQGIDGASPSPFSAPGIWSLQTIRHREGRDGLIFHEDGRSAFLKERLDPAGYRLAMGAEVYISPAKSKDKASVRSLEPREAFYIPPGQFAFLLTEELVKVPPDAFALIALRTRTKFKGLVNVSGFHADPGYHGRLIFAVFNAGPGDVHLRRGDDLFIISFATLDKVTERPRLDNERFLHIPSDIVTPIAGEVQSLAGLKEGIHEVREDFDERMHSMERDLAILRWAVALVLSAFVALLVRMLTAA